MKYAVLEHGLEFGLQLIDFLLMLCNDTLMLLTPLPVDLIPLRSELPECQA